MPKYNTKPTKTELKTPRISPNPSGLCFCGCGKMTKIATYNRPKYGWIKGEHLRYLRGHAKTDKPKSHGIPPNPSGLCMCGCGETTEIASSSNANRNCVKGEYFSYVHGHNTRISVSAEERFWTFVDKQAIAGIGRLSKPRLDMDGLS